MGSADRFRERVGLAGQIGEETLQLAPVIAQCRIQNLLQAGFACLRHQMRRRRGKNCVSRTGFFQHARARLADQFVRRLLVQHAKRGRHTGFERKARQQILAEGMNGLDFQSARRFQRHREQPARAAQIVGRATDLRDARGKFGIGQHRP